MHKFREEIKRHHRWLGVFLHFSPKFPRVLRVMALTTNIITMLFVQSLTYNLTKGDDGSCGELHSESECLAPRSGFATGTSQCYWTPAEIAQPQKGVCAFVEPDNDLMVMIFVAVFSAILSTPISLAANWVIHHVLAALTLAVTATWLGRTNIAGVRVLPLLQNSKHDLSQSLVHDDSLGKATSVVPSPLPPTISTSGGFRQKETGEAISLDNEVLTRNAERDFELLQGGLAAYYRDLSLLQRKEWGDVWGLNSEGHLLKNNHEKISPCGTSLKECFVTAKAFFIDTNNSVAEELLCELKNLHVLLSEETARFSVELPTEREKNKRLLFLFQQDLLPGISGQIIEAKDRRDEPQLRAVLNFTKKIAWLALGSLNTGMLFYIFLFAISQTASRQRAWANSFALWLTVEVLAVSTVMVFIMHVLLPLMAMRDVRKIKMRLLDSLLDYNINAEVHREASSEDKNKLNDNESKNHEISSALSSFNAAQFLFLSHKMAQLYPELKAAQIILRFRTSWPKQSYQRSTDLSKSYGGKFSAINKSLATVLMFFLTSFLSVPVAVQDIVMQISATAVVGYVLFVHVQLYEIYPALVVVPVLVVVAILHFFVKSSQHASSFFAPAQDEDVKHRDSTCAPIENVDKMINHGNNITRHSVSLAKTEFFSGPRHQEVPVQQLHTYAHVNRRASVAQGIVFARIAEQTLYSDESSINLSDEHGDENSLYSISEGSDDELNNDFHKTLSEDETGL